MNNTIKNVSSGVAGILGNSHIVHTVIIIDGKEILSDSNFKLNIQQKVADHDQFEIICPAESLEGFGGYPMANSRDYLGGKITIQLKHFDNVAYSFVGVITAIQTKKFDGYEGNIIISGYAPTVLLENGLHCQSFEKMPLKNIIEKATKDYPQDAVGFILKPNHTIKIPYTVQYRESDYQFIKRLATRHGEWFYYNGEKIIFGNNDEGIIDLEEESEMFEYEMKMKVVPQNFTYLSYISKDAKEISEDSEAAQKVSYSNPFLNHALKTSDKVFKKIPVSLYNHSLMIDGKQDLVNAVQRQKDKRANVFFVEGKSRKPELKLGSFIKMSGFVNGAKSFSSTISLETYRIIALTNHHDGIDDYYNTFVAVPYEIIVPDYMNEDAIPLCEEQSAIVVDNNDPNGMSRIRVQFPWQKQSGGKSPWIRVATPYAGKGKGFHVIPEEGEEVIVGFENGNAEKPFVLGAMFHGEGKSGHGGAGNYIKGFQTASGNKLQMNDKDGSINLTDKGGANMAFDGAGNATTNANSNHTINAGSTNVINVGGKNDSPPQSMLKMDDAGNIVLDGKTNITIKVGNSSITISNDSIVLKSENIKVEGIDELIVKGSEVKIEATTSLDVSGGSKATINSSNTLIH